MRSLHHIYSIWFLTWIEFVKSDIVIIFLQFIQDTVISRIHSLLLPYLNGTILIAKLETRGLSIFKKNLLNFIRPCANSIFNIHNPYRIKLLTRLRLSLSHLRDPKFRHGFQDTLNPLCDCGNDTETTTRFFLHCPSFHTPRQTLLNNIRNIKEQILSHGKDELIQTFLYGNPNFNLTVNGLIFNATIEYLISTERFNALFFQLIIFKKFKRFFIPFFSPLIL